MTDWRKQLQECINNQETRNYSWSDRRVPVMFYADSAFTPSPEEIEQFLKEIGYDCDNSR